MATALNALLTQVFAHSTDWRFKLLKNWPQIVGHLHTKMRIEKMSEDTIFLGVYDSSWMAELYALSRLLLKKINEALDQPRFVHVRFKLASVKQRSKIYKSKYSVNIARKPVLLNEKQRKALAVIKDPQLKEALTNFLARCEEQRCIE